MSIEVAWSRDCGTLVATLAGRIDGANSIECADALRSGIRDDEPSLILNLSQLEYIGSAGLRVLLLTARKFTRPGQGFGLCELSPRVGDVVTVSGFADIISVYGSQRDAVAAIAAGKQARTPATTEPADGGIRLQRSVDMDVLGENLSDIATYTIEKHEFTNPALSAGLREEAYTAITGVLWEEVERIMRRREEILAGMFQRAVATLEEVLARADE